LCPKIINFCHLWSDTEPRLSLRDWWKCTEC